MTQTRTKAITLEQALKKQHRLQKRFTLLQRSLPKLMATACDQISEKPLKDWITTASRMIGDSKKLTLNIRALKKGIEPISQQPYWQIELQQQRQKALAEIDQHYSDICQIIAWYNQHPTGSYQAFCQYRDTLSLMQTFQDNTVTQSDDNGISFEEAFERAFGKLTTAKQDEW